MRANPQDPYRSDKVAKLHGLIKGADTSTEVRRALLSELGFIETGLSPNVVKRLTRWAETPKAGVIITLLVFLVSLMYLSWTQAAVPPNAIVVVSHSPFTAAANVATLVVVVIGFWIGYKRWALAEENRNVDDTIRRKELANNMMVDNASVLLPYVADVFDIETQYAETLVTDRDRLKVQMYVFTEIDNLEFVFDKLQPGLLQERQALRAIKIFLARCENNNFERMARTLIEKGRYNHDFVQCVRSLLDVAHWARGQAFPTLER
jgi:hypothetical protein